VPADAGDIKVVVAGRLESATVAEVIRVVDAATEIDGVRPLSEHVMLHLRYGGDTDDRNLVALLDGVVVGYAHLDATDLVEGASAELVVDPAARGRGIGRALVAALIRNAGDRLRLWAHGEHPAAQRLAEGMGFSRIRALWQMRRSLFAPLPEFALPPGVVLRTFRPGIDDAAWLALNAAAFADHPEQGRWTLEDLHQRMAELWFDPAGFLLAERPDQQGRLVGFHWTKVHGDSGPAHGAESAHGHEPIGEVYVVGVDEGERGSGLGRALTIAGLQHLRSRGLASAMLYVDEENEAAIRLYTKLGFTHWDTDVMYRYPAQPIPERIMS
jgi:mycothiol synthase